MVFAVIAQVFRTVFTVVYDGLKFIGPPIYRFLIKVLPPLLILLIIASISGVGSFIVFIVIFYAYAQKVLTYDPANYGQPTK